MHSLNKVRIELGKFLFNHYKVYQYFTPLHRRVQELHGTIGAIIEIHHEALSEKRDEYQEWRNSRREHEDES